VGSRLFIQAPSGRHRFNGLEALNAITLQGFTVPNPTYLTAVQVWEWLTQWAALERGVPMTIVVDKARYQRCPRGLEHAARLGLELLLLPPHSPL
jgi:hypothetical protein